MPELSGDYLPGATGSGWITIELPFSYDGSLIRFSDSSFSEETRFFTWGDGSAPAQVDAGPTPEPAGVEFGPGTRVTVTESDVNLRSGPGSTFDVLEVLTPGNRSPDRSRARGGRWLHLV